MSAVDIILNDRYFLNMQRIGRLIAISQPGVLADELAKDQSTTARDPLRGDLCRAIVVFLHATLEDMLRTAGRERLAAASEHVLDKVPLVGKLRSRRAGKFSLGALAEHRGSTVDELIQRSVEDYLSGQSFTNRAKLDKALVQMGCDTRPFRPLYPDIGRMMRRRNRIVHEADLAPTGGNVATAEWTLADDWHMWIWYLTVMSLHNLLVIELSTDDTRREICRWYVERNATAIALARQAIINAKSRRDGSAESLLAVRDELCRGLTNVLKALHQPSNEDILVILKKTKAVDDHSTDEEMRAEIVAWSADSGTA